MGPGGVVRGAPVFDRLLGSGEREKPGLVAALIAEPAVEALDEGVLHRLAGLLEGELDPVCVGPGVQRPALKLRTMVGDQHRGPTPGLSEPRKDGHHLGPAAPPR